MTYPWTWYADPEVLRREQEHIFARTWQYVGHAGQVERVGDYFTAQLGRIPVDADRLHAADLGFDAHECRHLALVPAQDGDVHLVDDLPRRPRAIRGRTGADRV